MGRPNTGEPRVADVFAETPVECLVIRRQPLQAFLAQHPRVASFLTPGRSPCFETRIQARVAGMEACGRSIAP